MKPKQMAFALLIGAGVLVEPASPVEAGQEQGQELRQSEEEAPMTAPLPPQTLMIGDDIRDIEAGQAAGTQTALAAYGYVEPSIDRFDLSGCHVVQSPHEVLQLIESTTTT